jgi:hypothetical protein
MLASYPGKKTEKTLFDLGLSVVGVFGTSIGIIM